jgi:purine nucleoside phosphorylase
VGGRLGVVLGSGSAGLATGDGVVAIDRHGSGETEEGSGPMVEPYRLPHLIDHEANLRRLLDAGCDRVLGISSVGGLRPDLLPGSYVLPDDFIALDVPPVTTHSGPEAHRVAEFDPSWRREVVDAFRDATEIVDGGVYWQTSGPRLETPAEVRMIAQHAHIVGMTVGSECVVAGELGLRYAALCVVDNLANGVAGQGLTASEVRQGQAEHRRELEAVLASALGALAQPATP